MKRVIVMMVCMFAMLVMTGCGPSLKEYVSKSHNYYSKATSKTSVSVNIEPRNVVPEGRGVLGAIGAAVNTASAIGSLALSSDQEKRLSRLVSTERVVRYVAGGFDDSFANTTHLTVVDNSANPDLRVTIKVNKYGLWAESLASSIKFFVEADIQIVYTPEMTTIYSNGATIMRDTSSVLADAARLSSNFAATVATIEDGRRTGNIVGGVGSIATGAANLSAFFELTDDQIASIFDYLSYYAGTYIGDELVSDIYR